MNHRAIAAEIFRDRDRAFCVELWDGTVILGRGRTTSSRLVVHTARVVEQLLPPLDEEVLARAFACGDLDIVGDTFSVVEALARWGGPKLSIVRAALLVRARVRAASSRILDRARKSRGAHARERDARAVQHRYDLPDDFFRLFLDESMTYSCAYFPSGRESLAAAQEAKLVLLERKLDLKRGDRMLDVGCGWGSFLMHATQRCGVTASGATVSENQFQEAQRRTEVARGIQIYKRDYRELPIGPFDKIVSVGMMEHVGRQNLDSYFAEMYARLAPGGLFLNHAIADIAPEDRSVRWMKRNGRGFVQRYIFPDDDLPPLGEAIRIAEKKGFEVRDVESLREHYAQTLSCWLMNLERRFADAERIVGRETARMWRLYLAVSAVAFRFGKIGVHQLLLAKRTAAGKVVGVPRCRGAWYPSTVEKRAVQ